MTCFRSLAVMLLQKPAKIQNIKMIFVLLIETYIPSFIYRIEVMHVKRGCV